MALGLAQLQEAPSGSMLPDPLAATVAHVREEVAKTGHPYPPLSLTSCCSASNTAATHASRSPHTSVPCPYPWVDEAMQHELEVVEALRTDHTLRHTAVLGMGWDVFGQHAQYLLNVSCPLLAKAVSRVLCPRCWSSCSW